jgi:DNA modification methylase
VRSTESDLLQKTSSAAGLGLNILQGNCLDILPHLPSESAQCCPTSPPYYGLRDYGSDGQLGLEKTPQEYVNNLAKVFREVKRVLRNDGTLWLNLGDSYSGSGRGPQKTGIQAGNKGSTSVLAHFGEGLNSFAKFFDTGLSAKNLLGIPFRVVFALQEDGWIWRQTIIWNKTNCMVESVKDRPTTSHEYIFLLTKSPKYYYDYKAIQEPAIEKHLSRYNYAMPGYNKNCKRPDGTSGGQGGMHKLKTMRNKRSVWTTSTNGYKGAHFATFPEALITPCILAGSRPGDILLDPFAGSGTVGAMAQKYNRSAVLIELSTEYCELIRDRLGVMPLENAT